MTTGAEYSRRFQEAEALQAQANQKIITNEHLLDGDLLSPEDLTKTISNLAITRTIHLSRILKSLYLSASFTTHNDHLSWYYEKDLARRTGIIDISPEALARSCGVNFDKKADSAILIQLLRIESQLRDFEKDLRERPYWNILADSTKFHNLKQSLIDTRHAYTDHQKLLENLHDYLVFLSDNHLDIGVIPLAPLFTYPTKIKLRKLEEVLYTQAQICHLHASNRNGMKFFREDKWALTLYEAIYAELKMRKGKRYNENSFKLDKLSASEELFYLPPKIFDSEGIFQKPLKTFQSPMTASSSFVEEMSLDEILASIEGTDGSGATPQPRVHKNKSKASSKSKKRNKGKKKKNLRESASASTSHFSGGGGGGGGKEDIREEASARPAQANTHLHIPYKFHQRVEDWFQTYDLANPLEHPALAKQDYFEEGSFRAKFLENSGPKNIILNHKLPKIMDHLLLENTKLSPHDQGDGSFKISAAVFRETNTKDDGSVEREYGIFEIVYHLYHNQRFVYHRFFRTVDSCDVLIDEFKATQYQSYRLKGFNSSQSATFDASEAWTIQSEKEGWLLDTTREAEGFKRIFHPENDSVSYFLLDL